MISACLFAGSCARHAAPATIATQPDTVHVGPLDNGAGHIVSTRQILHPAGQSVEYHGRPVDLALAPDGKTLYVKDSWCLLAVEPETWTIRQKLAYPTKTGGSMHGIAVSGDGRTVYVTLAQSILAEADVAPDGKLAWGRRITLPPANKKEQSYPCGVALSRDGARALVCLSISDSLAIIDLTSGAIEKEISLGVAPYDVAISSDGDTAYVSNWGGRRPGNGDRASKSADSPIRIDEHGVAASGTVSVIDLRGGREATQIDTGLHPADIELSTDGKTLVVANANSDTVSVIDSASRRVAETISVRPDPSLPFGSISNALALAGDGHTLFVANGGNNAVAVVQLRQRDGERSKLQGFIPAGWFPGAIVARGDMLYVANTKGVGSRDPDAKKKWGVREYLGTITKVAVPDESQLGTYTRQAINDALVPQALRAWEKAHLDQNPTPVPQRVGEPSVFEHVVYVLKENRTYDQMLGDIGKGNSDPNLCIFGRDVSPNHHALAEQFALLDNYYCNGVLSPEGHAWSTEGITVDYLEKSFGAWARSYPFPGDDPLAFAPTGFIWDNALLHGATFRNYGEFTTSDPIPASAKFADVYGDYVARTGSIKATHKMELHSLVQYSCMQYPGWELRIPDQVRADVFLKEFDGCEKAGRLPNLTLVYLPNDHTSGTKEDQPTPAAMVADNDLALGRIVDAISHSRFWPNTCIIVIEDDPQDGFDHVDGHRSICLVASPYTKRGAIISDFYNQTSVLHTIELMLGLPPMNQMDAMAAPMRSVFTDKPDFSPYTVLPNKIPLDQMNPPKSVLSGAAREFAEASDREQFDLPDRADEDTLNRILWMATRGESSPYPAAFAGAHGNGLKALHLKLDVGVKDDDD